jgi:hypothetical protein
VRASAASACVACAGCRQRLLHAHASCYPNPVRSRTLLLGWWT